MKEQEVSAFIGMRRSAIEFGRVWVSFAVGGPAALDCSHIAFNLLLAERFLLWGVCSFAKGKRLRNLTKQNKTTYP